MQPFPGFGAAPWGQVPPPALAPAPGSQDALNAEFKQLSGQIEATMKQAAAGGVVNSAQLQAMQARVSQLMAQYDQSGGGPAPGAPFRPPAPGHPPQPPKPQINPQEEPQKWVDQQRQELIRAERAAKAAASEYNAYIGVIARYSHVAGAGALECAEATAKLGGDVQIMRHHFAGLEVGDTVVFTAVRGERGGPPNAQLVKRLSELTQQRRRILEVEAPYPAPGTVESAQEYIGFITTFQPDRGFGFVSCAQTRQMYGSDVYIHRDQFLDVAMGDAIHFRVALNPKGMPVARGVHKSIQEGNAGDSGASAASGSAVRPELQKVMQSAGFKSGDGDATEGKKKKKRARSDSSMELSKSPTKKKAKDKKTKKKSSSSSSSESRDRRRARSRS